LKFAIEPKPDIRSRGATHFGDDPIPIPAETMLAQPECAKALNERNGQQGQDLTTPAPRNSHREARFFEAARRTKSIFRR
jgi:hypothetical protein